MYKRGLKLWSINTDYYLQEAVRLYQAGYFDYIELYVVPDSIDTLEKWKQAQSGFKFPSSGIGSADAENGGKDIEMKSGAGFKFPSSGGVPARAGWLERNLTEKNHIPIISRNTKNYKDLPYNPSLKKRAKELRKAGNLAEVLLWKEIKNKKLKGLDFDRQKIIGNYIVDFYCAEKNAVIEIDGVTHDYKQKYDAVREEYLKSLGLCVIHLADRDVKKNLEGILKYLSNHPALAGTPPEEGNLSPAPAGTPPKEGNLNPAPADIAPEEGNLNPAPADILTECFEYSKRQKIPFIIHNAHFAQGFNLAKKEKELSNIKIYEETKKFADELNAEYIIFHGGIDGCIEETARQLSAFNEPRALIENKPYIALPNRMGGNYCRGYSIEEIQHVMDKSGCGFCFDFGHAVCAANSLKKEIYEYCRSFLKLKPAMYHLTDITDITSPYDAHPHLGAGQLNFSRIFEMIPDNSYVTFETNKNSKENLDDFIEDMKWLQYNLP